MAVETTNFNLLKPAVNDPVDQDLWGGYLNGNFDIIDAQLKAVTDLALAVSSIPIGCPIPYMGDAAPTNYLLCYGQTIGKAGSGADLESDDYEELFNVVRNLAENNANADFDGLDTVIIKDLRGVVVAGKDNMGGTSADRLTGLSGGVDGDVLGSLGGAESHTLTLEEFEHTHETGVAQRTSLNNAHQIRSWPHGTSGSYATWGQGFGSGDSSSRASLLASPPMDDNGSPSAHNNVQPTVILNQIVRFK